MLDLRKLLKALYEQGYTVTVTATQRYMVRNSRGDVVTVISPRAKDWRALKNALAELRADGFVWRR